MKSLTKEEQILVEENMWVVNNVAKHYHTFNKNIDYRDLLQAGYEGLIHAAKKFDKEKGYKFSTYASWWAKSIISRAALKYKDMPVNTRLIETVIKINKLGMDHYKQYGKFITTKELLKLDDRLTRNKIDLAREYLQISHIPILSLEEYKKDKTNSITEDILENNDLSQYEKLLLKQDLMLIKQILKSFSKEKQVIIEKRILSEEVMSLRDLAELLYINKLTETKLLYERIRQLQNKTLKEIRSLLKNY